MNANQPVVLFFDEDRRALDALFSHFKGRYEVVCVASIQKLFSYLDTHRVDVFVCSQKISKSSGMTVLKEVAKHSPATVCILMTEYADLANVIDHVHKYNIYRYITKPWNVTELEKVIGSAVVHAQQLRSLSDSAQDDKFSTLAKHEKLLVVDQCAETYDLLHAQFSNVYDITWANSMDKALDYTKQDSFGVIISDISLNKTCMSMLFERLRVEQPLTMMMVLTHFHENKELEELIRNNTIYRCLPKPVRASILQMSVERAMRMHRQFKADVALKLAEPQFDTASNHDSQRVLDYIQLHYS